MRNYLIKLSYDNGSFNIQVRARNKKVAIDMITKAENCPESAITKIIHLKKGVKKYAD